MKVRKDQLERLATAILANFRAKELIKAKRDDSELRNKIVEILAQNFAEEEAIEEEARKVLATHAQAARDMDPYRMFLLAKQKLAAKKGFIL
jgi:hypothetical protein